MSRHEFTRYFPNNGARNQVRKRVILEFLKEKPGIGKGDLASRYRYNVEKLHNGFWIYLERPGFLNKQFDFVINVENVNFGKSKVRHSPTHNDIFNDLKKKKKKNPYTYKKLYLKIQQIYYCKKINIRNHKLRFKAGYSADMLLGVIKWYFIEQDVAYWNYSGRAMFMNGIPKP